MLLQTGNKILRFSHDSFHSEIEIDSVDDNFAYSKNYKFYRVYNKNKLVKVAGEEYDSADWYDDFFIKNPSTIEGLKGQISRIQAKSNVEIVDMLLAVN